MFASFSLFNLYSQNLSNEHQNNCSVGIIIVAFMLCIPIICLLVNNNVIYYNGKEAAAEEEKARKGPGRPKGSKNKSKRRKLNHVFVHTCMLLDGIIRWRQGVHSTRTEKTLDALKWVAIGGTTIFTIMFARTLYELVTNPC